MADRSGVVPQLLGAAVGIVLGSALLFAVVGMLRDDGPPSPEVAADASPSAAAEEPAADDAEEEPSPDDAPADEDGDAAEEPATEPTEVSEDPADEPTEEPTAPAADVDPSTISIQVLDAVGSDGGSAAQEVADELREAGFDVIVVNQAGRDYDVTTVFWSPGQVDGGQAVAAAIGAGQAEETPEEVRLSDSVDVHVVVGADRARPKRAPGRRAPDGQPTAVA